CIPTRSCRRCRCCPTPSGRPRQNRPRYSRPEPRVPCWSTRAPTWRARAGCWGPWLAGVSGGGLVRVRADWGLDEILRPSTGPAEIDARLRLVVGRRGGLADQESAGKVSLGKLVIDEGTYTARLRGRPLDLTYKEFELLKYLAQHAGRGFTRAQLLAGGWGYDFFGGTRTVDVHVRRLRAKLGSEH